MKNTIHTAVVESYASDGSGVCRIGGRAVFVRGALVGELWEIRILRVTKTAVYGKGEQLLSPAAGRVEPKCPVFGKCGGCDLMHMSYEEELSFKLARVNDALHRIGRSSFAIHEILPADTLTHYRNKAIFAVGGSADAPTCGYFRRRSHEIVPAGQCLITPELSCRCAEAVRSWCQSEYIAPYDEASGKGHVRHVFTRIAFSTGQAQCVIVTARGFGTKTSSLTEALLARCPELTSIVLCINKAPGNTVLTGQLHTLWGTDTITEQLCGLHFSLSPFSFFQINPPQTEKLYSRALAYAAPDGLGTVLDLYCGAGTISLCLAKGAEQVIGAEIVPEAVENARKNAQDNGIENVEFICADAGQTALQLASQGIAPDAIVVDPPRKGLSVDVISAIGAMSPKRVVYVSCDPGTLARDLSRFTEDGWSPVSGTVVDMFPRTANMETVLLLQRGNCT